MEYVQLTKRENQVMDILWKENHEMSANEIAQTDVYTMPYAVKTVLRAWNAKHPDKAVPVGKKGGGADAS